MVPVLLLWETEHRSLFTKTRTELRNSKTTNSYEIFYLNECLYGHLPTVDICFRDSVDGQRAGCRQLVMLTPQNRFNVKLTQLRIGKISRKFYINHIFISVYTLDCHWPHLASKSHENLRQMLIFTVSSCWPFPSPNPKALIVVWSRQLIIQYIRCCLLHLMTVSSSRNLQTHHTVLTDTD